MKKKFSKILGVGLTLALLFSLLLTAAPVSADVSQITVDVDKDTISIQSIYDITFSVNDEIPNDGLGWIEIRFPEGTIIDELGSYDDGDISIQSTAGFGDANDGAANILDVSVSAVEDPDDVWTLLIDVDDLANPIGEDSRVRVTIDEDAFLFNPDDPGTYTLEVRTSEEDDWVESAEYDIDVPDVDVLPGVVEIYNASDILMDSFTGDDAITDAIAAADEDYTIKLGVGEYTEDPTTADDGVTIEGSGNVEDIIIFGLWTISNAEITLDNLTLDGDEGDIPILIDVGAVDFTIENSILQYAGTALIDDDGSTADDPTIIDNVTFNIDDEIGVDVGSDGVEITDSTFNIDDGGTGIGVVLGADAEVSDSTFNGGSGTGVRVNAGDSEISGSMFDGLDTAFDINGGIADINTNIIQNSEGVAIDVAGTDELAIHNNTFTGNDDDVIIAVADNGDAEDIYMMFNTITDNAGDDDLLIDNNDTDIDLIAINNWWGDADGPAQGEDAFSDDVEFEPFLPGPIGNSAILVGLAGEGDTADFEDDVGVQVDNDDADIADLVEIIGAAQYTTNPVGDIDDAVAFWDVVVIDDGDVTQVTLRFYADVTEDSELWVWGAAIGEWVEAEAAVANVFGGFMMIEIDANSTPALDDLGELPFAVVEPEEDEELDDNPTITAPESGADDVSLTPTFAWEAAEDADAYYFELADNANFVLPLVKLDGDIGRLIVTAYAYVGELPYSTAYYWRVKAVEGSIEGGDLVGSDWVSAVFITKAEPVEPADIILEPADIILEPADIIIQPPDVIVTLPAETPITPSWIYVIIAVGAVLVIALLVLIVRTRRVA